MKFSDSGLPQEAEVEKAFSLLEETENAWANDNRIKIVRNITDSYASPPADIAAAALLSLYVDDQVRSAASRPGDVCDLLATEFSGGVMEQLKNIRSADMDAVLGWGRTESLAGAHSAAKIYAMGHALFMLEDCVEKGFNGRFTVIDGVMGKDPPDEYMLKSVSGLIRQTIRIRDACHGVHAPLESRLVEAVKSACHAVDAAEDELLRQKRAWRDRQLSGPSTP